MEEKVEGITTSYDPDHIDKQDHLCIHLNIRGNTEVNMEGLHTAAIPATCFPLPSIQLANVQALDNWLDSVHAHISCQRDIRNCNVLCHLTFVKSRNTEQHHSSRWPFFSIHQCGGTEDWQKKGGGVCFMVNKDWCDSGNIKMLSAFYQGNLHWSLSQASHHRPSTEAALWTAYRLVILMLHSPLVET